jgi:hypothetical protein
MFCEKCGVNQPDNAVFCQNCGSKMGETANPQTKSTNQSIPESKPAPQERPEVQSVQPEAKSIQPQTYPIPPKGVPQDKAAQPQGVPSQAIPVQPQGAKSFQQPVYQVGANDSLSAPLGVGSYLGMFILMAIPLVNIVALIMWLVGSTTNKNKKNFAIAAILFSIIMIAISIVLIGLSAAFLVPFVEEIQYGTY